MSDSPEAADLAELPYEQLYQKLEETVRQLDSGDLPLAEALACYERGMQLAAACQRLLDRSELRIRQIAGSLERAPLLEPRQE